MGLCMTRVASFMLKKSGGPSPHRLGAQSKPNKCTLKKKKAKEKAKRERLEPEALEETTRALAAAGVEFLRASGVGGGQAATSERDYTNPEEVQGRIEEIQKTLKQTVALKADEMECKDLNVDQTSMIPAIPDKLQSL